ncbi:MAG: SMP-30/gluconolactonase/LRE family protein [Pseudomonadota bacterium]
MSWEVYDDRPCTLGEGPIWHRAHGQLLWFDIVAGRLLSGGDGAREWTFDEPASAAAELADGRVLVATATGLTILDLASDACEPFVSLEADDPAIRSNDGRPDPWGGLWIGTMGFDAEPEAGAIYRVTGREVRTLFPRISVPNGICFAPDRSVAYLADSAIGVIWRQPLDEDGWPDGAREIFVDDGPAGLPDGAVCDADGYVWSARWGGSCVLRFAPDGRLDHRVDLPTAQVTCPAFGGEGFDTLYVTTARQGLDAESLAEQPHAGQTFRVLGTVPGRPEPLFIPD